MALSTRDKLTVVLLSCGLLVPLLYYGIQLFAAPAFPDFSFNRITASELGSDLSPRARLFNVGIMVQGIASLLAAVGYWLALRRLGTNLFVALLTFFVVAMSGFQSLWAAYYPMPHPSHGGHPAFLVAMLLLPFVLTVALWRHGGWPLRIYFLATLLLLAAMVPVMSGIAGVDKALYRGLCQRIFTLTIFPPIGVAAWVLLRRIQAAAGPFVG